MKSLLLSVCLFLLAWTAFAQSDRGTLTGTISDPAGAVIANAAIEARHVETGTVYPAVSTATGNYTVPQLPVGTYEVSVSVPGFKRFVRGGIKVATASVERIDVALEVGAATESVTVEADASLLKTESADVSHNVTVQNLNELPMLGVGSAAAGSSGIRNPNGVVGLVPGTYYVPNSQVKINGAPTNTMAIHVEGMDSTNVGFPYAGAQTQPSVDAIQEVSVQTSNFAPEFGTSGGGFFNFTMRSGTNQYHGSAYDYFVNEVFNAGTPFTDAGTTNSLKAGQLVRPPARRNDYGFTLGGPIDIPKIYNGHDKTFFFFNFEQYRETIQVNNIYQTVPIDAYRNGDFSRALTALGNKSLGTDVLGRPMLSAQIYDPSSVFTAPGGQLVTNPFANNAIPLAMMDQVSLKIQKNIPEPNQGAGLLVNNWLPSYPATRHTTIPAVKIDQSLGARAKLSFYWSFTHTDAPYSNIYGQSEGLPDILTATRGTFIHSHVERLNYDMTLSPTLLLHLGAGYQQNNFFDDAPITNFNAAQTYGLVGATVNRNIPVINFAPPLQPAIPNAAGGMIPMGPGAGQGHSYWEKPAGNASITWVKGNHTYKAGAEVFFSGVPNIPYSNTNGNYTFSQNETAIPYIVGASGNQSVAGLGGTLGFPYASFLLGAVDSYNIAAPSEVRNGKQQWGAFLQDSWKVTRKLTVDYGLRWDYGTYYKEQYGREMDFSPATPNPSAGGHAGAFIFEGSGPGHCNCSFASNYPYAIGPRVGAAYQVTPKTVIRAGWGLVYSQSGTTSLGIANPGTAATNTVGSSGFGAPPMHFQTGIPANTIPTWPVINNGIFPAPPSTFTPTLPTGVGMFDPQAGRPARQSQWSIGVQRELTRDLVVEATYVGNRGVWWQAPGLVNVNAVTSQILQAHGIDITNPTDQALLTSSVTSATAIARGITIPYAGFPTNQSVAQALRPFPQFGNIPVTAPPLGKTWYDSLQTKITKRLSRGLLVSSAFTWQKSLQEGVDTSTQLNNILANKDNSKSYSSYDQPYSFFLTASYTTPKLAGNRLASAVLRDWTIGTLLQYASGLPIATPTAANSTTLSNQIFQGTLANRVAGQPLYTVSDINCHCYDPSNTFILNKSAWANPAAGQFSNSAQYYGDFRYWRHPQENMNFGRIFRITERVNVNLRIEFSNVFNRTQFTNTQLTATGYTAPQSTNPNGTTAGGFGYFNRAVASNQLGQPRSGTIVARFTF